MLRKIDQAYVDDLKDVIRHYVVNELKDVALYYACLDNECRQPGSEEIIQCEVNLGCGLYVVVRVTLTQDNTLAEDADGRALLDCLDVRGDWFHFLALCLQEGELIPSEKLLKSKEQKHRYGFPDFPNVATIYRSINLDGTPYRFDVDGWMSYVANKFQIFVPLANGHTFLFRPLLEKGYFYVTGGLAVARPFDDSTHHR